MSSTHTVVFVCLHGTAKSVIAATYMNRLSAERGLNIRATAVGMEPEPDVPPHVRKGLLRDGLDVRHYRARRVTHEALAAAWRVVSFGCDLSHVAPPGLAVVRWDDVPLVSDGFPPARDAIVRRVRQLLEGYESDQVETHQRCGPQRQAGREKAGKGG
jgi:arsenate reductase (thioredoxin)